MEKIIRGMLEYQKENNIKGQCLMNTGFLLDTLLANGYDAKAKAVIAKWGDAHAGYVVIHMVIEIGEGELIDPSYEIYSQNATYVDKICNAFHGDEAVSDTGLNKKQLVATFLQFLECAEVMNTTKKRPENEYYHAQIDYLEKMMGRETARM